METKRKPKVEQEKILLLMVDLGNHKENVIPQLQSEDNEQARKEIANKMNASFNYVVCNPEVVLSAFDLNI